MFYVYYVFYSNIIGSSKPSYISYYCGIDYYTTFYNYGCYGGYNYYLKASIYCYWNSGLMTIL